jgi:hypothetical protein
VIPPNFGSSLLTPSHLLLHFSISLTMPPRKQPPQQDLEQEDDDLVTSKQFTEMMHMMESLTVSMNETFNKTTPSMNEMLHKFQASTETALEWMQRGIAAMADRVQALETQLPITATDPNATAADTHADDDPFAEDPRVDNDEHSELPDPPPCQRQPFNRQGMGGNQNYHNQHYVRNDDPFAKVKFSIPPFNGLYDADAYVDWEMIVEQSLVPTLFLNNIVLGKPLVSLKLLLSGVMN